MFFGSKIPTGNPLDRYLIIYSRKSGRRKLRNREGIIRRFFEKHTIPYFFTALDEAHPKPEDLSLSEIRKGFPFNKVLIAGGDGTIRRVVEYLYFHDLLVPISIFPLGSANIYSRVLKMSFFFEINLRRILHPAEKSMSIGIINGRHIFLAAACFGKAAQFSIDAHHCGKHLIGSLSYLITAFKTEFDFQSSRISYRNEKGISESIPSHSVVVFPDESAKGFMPYLPEKLANFYLTFLRNMTPFGLFRILYSAKFRKKEPKEMELRSAEKVILENTFGTMYHLDGDIMEDSPQKFEIETAPKRVTFLI